MSGYPGNISLYENPYVDELLAEDAPMAYLIHTNSLLGVNTNYVDNVLVDPVNYVRFQDVEFVE